MRLPWVSKYRAAQHLRRTRERNHGQRVESLKVSLSEVEQQRDEAREEVTSQLGQVLYWAAMAGKHKDERDEALARVADLERALGQFSAGEAADIQAARDNLPDEAKITYGLGGSRQTGDHADLCDCAVSNWNEHRVGHCGTAHREAALAGMFMSTDCTCPPGWKHRAADCPFNPNPEQKQGQRHG